MDLDNEILTGLEKFAGVWPRVTGEVPAARDDGETLRRLIDGEAASMAYYERVAAMSSGRCRQMALQHLADERRHLHALQTEYFLRHGDSHRPQKPKPERMPLLSFLRKVYHAELSGAEGYRRAAQADAELAALYTRHAADEARHAASVRRYIERAI